MDSPFLEAIKGRRSSTAPVWFMRQAGRFLPEYRRLRAKEKSFFDLCRNVELAVEITALPVKLLKVDAAILFSDLLVPLLPLKSLKVEIKEGIGPIVESLVPLTESEKLLHPYNIEELGFVAEIVSGFKNAHPYTPLIGFCGAPFTLLSYILERGSSKHYHSTKRFMFEHPEAFRRLMELATELLVKYAKMQISAGVDAFQVFDSWVGALSPEDYERYVFEHTKKLVEEISKTKIPVIYFSTGTCGSLKVIKKLPCNAFSVDWRISLEDAINILGKHRVIQGNLDPSALFLPKEELKKRVEAILIHGRKADAHIFNLGHGVFPDTDPDKVRWVVEVVHSFRWD